MKKFLRWEVAVILLALGLIFQTLGLLSVSHPKVQTVQAQAFAVKNGTNVSVAPDAVVFVPSQQGSVRVYSISSACGSGTGQASIAIAPPGGPNTTIWETGLNDIGTTLSSYYWPTPLQGPPGGTIELFGGNNCGGNVILNYQVSVN